MFGGSASKVERIEKSVAYLIYVLKSLRIDSAFEADYWTVVNLPTRLYLKKQAAEKNKD